MKKLLTTGLIVLSLILAGCNKNDAVGAVVGADISKERSCKDSDGGINQDVKGIMTIGENTYVDFCANGILVEYYCDGNNKANQNIGCPNKCSNGKCI